ncbi:MAG: hypothetical protein ACI399_05025 [Candidatus Cryptobacteroides sp.]
MKIKDTIVWTVCMLLCSISMPAQDMPPLAPDASVVSGALPNGISYYIVTNPAQSGMADFALVRKGCTDTVAARNELSTLPHFNKTIPYKFLTRKNIGCRPEGLVSFEEGSTVFRFDDVPVYDQAASDTTLLMMFDMIASKPCQHAIIIAGNVTPANILEKMKVFSLMVPSRSPEYSKPEYSFTGGIAPEYSFTPSDLSTLTVDFRSPRFPDVQMGTIQPFMSRLYCLELAEIVKSRLRYAFTDRQVKVKSFDVEYVGSSQTMGDEHFVVRVEADESQMIQATAALASVLSETAKRGVPEGEYLASRDYVYKMLCRPQTNDDLVRMCISNYLTGSDLALPATKVAFFSSKNMDSGAEKDLFNNFVEALLSRTGNMSVHWTGNEESFDEWTRIMTFSSTWKTVALLDRPTINWNVAKKDTVNLWSDRGKTKLKNVSPEAASGGEIWLFANDVKVVYKKDASLKGQFGYALMVKGGYSTAKDLRPGEGAFLSDILSISDVSGLMGADFDRLMRVNGIGMEMSVSPSDLRITGTAATNQLSLVLRSLLSVSNSRNTRKTVFDAYSGYQKSILTTDKVDSLLYPDNPYPAVKSPSALTDHVFETARNCFESQFMKINDGVIILVGDLPYESTQKILSNYLGCFRISKGTGSRINSSYRLEPGNFTIVEDGPSSRITIGLAACQKYTPDNLVSFHLATMVLKRRLSAGLSKIGYSVSMEKNFGVFPQEIEEVRFVFTPCPPEGLPEETVALQDSTDALMFIRQLLSEAMSAPVDAGELNYFKATVASSYATTLTDRVSYINALLMRYSSGKDMLTGYATRINSIQPQQVQAVLTALSQGRKVEYVIR